MILVKCPSCKGKKTQTITVHTFGEKKVEKMELKCIDCDGKGEISEETFERKDGYVDIFE